MFENTNTRYPQALRCVRLPSELRKPIEKSACLATIVRAIAYLAGLEQTTGHRLQQSNNLAGLPQDLSRVPAVPEQQCVPGLCLEE
jgi:hypothetical protein